MVVLVRLTMVVGVMRVGVRGEVELEGCFRMRGSRESDDGLGGAGEGDAHEEGLGVDVHVA